jgi:hypothetical protein
MYWSRLALLNVKPKLSYQYSKDTAFRNIGISNNIVTYIEFVTNNNGFWIKWLDQWLSRTRSIPYWTTSVFSFTVMNDKEFLLNLFTALNDVSEESLLNEFSHVLTFITLEELNRGHQLEQFILLLFVLSIALKCSNLLLSNGGATVDCVTMRMCLLKHCLAMDYSRFQASCHKMLVTNFVKS